MSSPSLNLSLILVKAYLLLIKLLQLVLILASNLCMTSHALLTTFLLFKINLLLLVCLILLTCMVHLFFVVVLSLTSDHLIHLKVLICRRSPFRFPVLCHELTPSTIYKAIRHTRASSPRIPGLLNVNLFSLSMMTIKVMTIYTMATNLLRKIMRMNVPHATSSPTLMRSPPMKTIGWQEAHFEVLTAISNCLTLIHLQTRILNTNLKTTT